MFQILLGLFSLSPTLLQPGDVLLQSAQCSLCTQIEQEESSAYSHAGVVSVSEAGAITVIQAWGNVNQVSLENFISKRTPQTKTLVLRGKSFIAARAPSNEDLLKAYQEHFAGHHYDPEFLWDNQDRLGEKLYCSELVVKLLNLFLVAPIQPKPMHYTYQRDVWVRYFNSLHRDPPDQLLGVSPGDIARSENLTVVGEL